MLVGVNGEPLSARKPTSQQPRVLRAKYDSASGDTSQANHWAQADSLSSVKANSESVRQRLRDRARYESANNSYCRGLVDTLANFLIGGTGPSLSLNYRGELPADEMRSAGRRVEWLWSSWSYERRLAQKLWTIANALYIDGESFGLLIDDRETKHTPVTLNLRLYEADQFSPGYSALEEDDSGVRLDSNGEPTEYAILSSHPGDGVGVGIKSQWLPASQVVHVFRKERPGQLRGIPRLTPSLPLFAMLRRFVLATIDSAEFAASQAGVLSQDIDGDDAEIATAWARVEYERGAFLQLPAKTKLAQLAAEHPNATFEEFVKAILREIARCLNVPAVLALGDASSYNFSSGKLDLRNFEKFMQVERSQLFERELLDKLLNAWMDEAFLLTDFLPSEFVSTWSDWEWSWRYPGDESIDRQKEATGQAQELSNHTTTLAREYARRNLDWVTELTQRAKEIALMRELGLSQEQAAPAPDVEEDGAE